MTIDTKIVQELRTSLSEALSASQEFQPVLAAELEALQSADLQSLNEIVQRKKQLTDSLLQASQRLLGWCNQQNIEPDYAAFKVWSQALPEADRLSLQQSWLDLRQSLDENSRSSAVNRQVLSSLTSRNQARLALLKNLLGAPNTYSASGTQESGMGLGGGWVDRV